MQYTVIEGEVADIAAADDHVAWAARVAYEYYYPYPQGGPMWMLPREGDFLKTADGGGTWTPQYPPEPCPPLEIAVVDAATAWAAGLKPGAWTGDGAVLRTTGGGDAGPDIISLDPASAPAGTEVIISCRDFGETQGTSRVLFGDVEAPHYAHRSDTQVTAAVPEGITGDIEVKVVTPEGTSNPVLFSLLAVTNVSPAKALQFTVPLNLKIDGSGFLPGAKAKLAMGSSVIHASNTVALSGDQVSAAFYLVGVPPGAYDVVVTNPDGSEARLEGGFTVTPVCGQGGGAALLMLGVSLGILSLAGSRRLRRTGSKGE